MRYYRNITCPGFVTDTRCKSIDSCYAPAGTTVNPYRFQTCASTKSQLVSLGVFNGVVAAMTVFAGHDDARKWLRKLSRRPPAERWTPWAGIFAAFTQFMAMIFSSVMAYRKASGTNFAALLGLWTLRPRIGFLTYVWNALMACLKGEQAYEWTIKDIVVSESVLNIVALGFAWRFYTRDDVDPYNCRPPGYTVPKAKWIRSSVIFAVVAGIASILTLAAVMLQRLSRFDYSGRGSPRWQRWREMAFAAFEQVPAILMISCFASNWILWGGK